jgi:hypothetical protein
VCFFFFFFFSFLLLSLFRPTTSSVISYPPQLFVPWARPIRPLPSTESSSSHNFRVALSRGLLSFVSPPGTQPERILHGVDGPRRRFWARQVWLGTCPLQIFFNSVFRPLVVNFAIGNNRLGQSRYGTNPPPLRDHSRAKRGRRRRPGRRFVSEPTARVMASVRLAIPLSEPRVRHWNLPNRPNPDVFPAGYLYSGQKERKPATYWSERKKELKNK